MEKRGDLFWFPMYEEESAIERITFIIQGAIYHVASGRQINLLTVIRCYK